MIKLSCQIQQRLDITAEYLQEVKNYQKREKMRGKGRKVYKAILLVQKEKGTVPTVAVRISDTSVERLKDRMKDRAAPYPARYSIFEGQEQIHTGRIHRNEQRTAMREAFINLVKGTPLPEVLADILNSDLTRKV